MVFPSAAQDVLKMQNNLHIYPSPFRNETRILKETGSLVAAACFDRIFIAAMWQEGLKEREPIDNHREVFRIKLGTRRLPTSLGKVVRHLEWGIRVFLRFRTQDIAVVNCHALSTLPWGVLLKLLCGSSLIYDTHELETETHHSRGLRKRCAKILERSMIRWADEVIVVSPSIAAWYRQQYGLTNVHLVRNVPYRREQVAPVDRLLLRTSLGIKEDELLFIYQGQFSAGRGIENLLEIWPQLERKRHLVFMGNGELEDRIAKQCRQSPNIHLHPAVPLKDILKYTSGADVGIALFEASCLNYLYVLPNKLFEYLFAGVPVIISDFPDMAMVVDEFACGWKTAADASAMLSLVQSIERPAIIEKQAGAQCCHAQCGWDLEAVELLKAYKSIMANRREPPSR